MTTVYNKDDLVYYNTQLCIITGFLQSDVNIYYLLKSYIRKLKEKAEKFIVLETELQRQNA